MQIIVIKLSLFFLSIILSYCSLFLPRKKRHLDTDAAPAGEVDADSEEENECETDVPSAKKQKINKKGQKVLGNGAIAMRDLKLAAQVPPKNRDDEALELFKAKLSLSKASTFFTLVIHGKNMPIEKVRDDIPRAVLFHSSAPYSLSKANLDIILGADADERKAYLIGLVKNAQQVVKYILPGLVGNYMNEMVLTKRDVYPTDDVKLHLGLTGANAKKSFMEL